MYAEPKCYFNLLRIYIISSFIPYYLKKCYSFLVDLSDCFIYLLLFGFYLCFYCYCEIFVSSILAFYPFYFLFYMFDYIVFYFPVDTSP